MALLQFLGSPGYVQSLGSRPVSAGHIVKMSTSYMRFKVRKRIAKLLFQKTVDKIMIWKLIYYFAVFSMLRNNHPYYIAFI